MRSNTICLLFFVAIALVQASLIKHHEHNEVCTEPRIRRAWRTTPAAEKNLFLEALLTAKQLGYYDQFIAIHKSNTNAGYSHGTSLFLPWHRWYIFQFENLLRSLSPRFKCLTIPYWDWERDAGRESASRVFDGNLGYIRASNVSKCVRDGLFSERNGWVVDGRCLKREYDPKITFMGEVGLLLMLSTPDYTEFRLDLEARAHGAPHAWLNGDMGDFTSPNDPMFFLHHSNIDRLWSMWQDCHDYDRIDLSKVKGTSHIFYEPSEIATFGNFSEPMPYTYLNGMMEPFLYKPGTLRSPSVKEIFHIMDNHYTGQHYAYDPADNLVSLFTKFNPAMCRWDWFLGPPTRENKDTWGISWLRRVKSAPKKFSNKFHHLAPLNGKHHQSHVKRSLEENWISEQLAEGFHVKYNYINSTHFRMRVESKTPGWAAIGFNPESGGMTQSDMVIVSSDDRGHVFVGDFFSPTYGMPELDEVQSLHDASGEISETGTWMEFTRAFDTHDHQDKPIVVNGKNTLVWGFGKTRHITKHESHSRGFKPVAFPAIHLLPDAHIPVHHVPNEHRNSAYNPSGNHMIHSRPPVVVHDPVPTHLSEPGHSHHEFPEVHVEQAVYGKAQLSPHYHLKWKIHGKVASFEIKVTPSNHRHHMVSRAIPTTDRIGWVALGFNPADGGMFNADMIIGNVHEMRVHDYVSTGYVQPSRDIHTGNQENLLSASIEVLPDLTIRMKFSRYLDTQDEGDRPILPGITDLVWAYGPGDLDKHWIGSKGAAKIDLFLGTEECHTECLRGQGRCSNHTCICFQGWTGAHCEQAAAFPNISITQLPNTQLRDTIRRLRFKNGGLYIPKGLPGNRSLIAHVSQMMTRAYQAFAHPKVGSPRIDKLWTEVCDKNSKTSKLPAKDKITILVLAECAVTAGPGRQYVSDDWLMRNGVMEKPDKTWEPACPTKTCCNTTKMISEKMLCPKGVGKPTCNPSTCHWEYNCHDTLDLAQGRVVAKRIDYSHKVPRKDQILIFKRLHRVQNANKTHHGRPQHHVRPHGRPQHGQHSRPHGKPQHGHQQPHQGKPQHGHQQPHQGKPHGQPHGRPQQHGHQQPHQGKPQHGRPQQHGHQQPHQGKPQHGHQQPHQGKPHGQPHGRPQQHGHQQPHQGKPQHGHQQPHQGKPHGQPHGRPQPPQQHGKQPHQGRPQHGHQQPHLGRPHGRPQPPQQHGHQQPHHVRPQHGHQQPHQGRPQHAQPHHVRPQHGHQQPHLGRPHQGGSLPTHHERDHQPTHSLPGTRPHHRVIPQHHLRPEHQGFIPTHHEENRGLPSESHHETVVSHQPPQHQLRPEHTGFPHDAKAHVTKPVEEVVIHVTEIVETHQPAQHHLRPEHTGLPQEVQVHVTEPVVEEVVVIVSEPAQHHLRPEHVNSENLLEQEALQKLEHQAEEFEHAAKEFEHLAEELKDGFRHIRHDLRPEHILSEKTEEAKKLEEELVKVESRIQQLEQEISAELKEIDPAHQVKPEHVTKGNFAEIRLHAQQPQDVSNVPHSWPETPIPTRESVHHSSPRLRVHRVPHHDESHLQTNNVIRAEMSRAEGSNDATLNEVASKNSSGQKEATWPVFALVLSLVGAVALALLMFMIIPSLATARTKK